MNELNNFFSKGFCLGEPLPALLFHRYNAMIKATNFVREEGDDSLTADWESDLPSENENIPQPYLDLMKIVMNQSAIAQWFQIRYGDFSRINVMLQKSAPGHQMDWHFDGMDPMDLVCLIYFTESEWKAEQGGQLLVGEGDCNEYGLIDDQDGVRVIDAISPGPGKVVWTLNTNPRMVHKVTPVTTDKSRIVLIGQFGYQENAQKTRVKEWLRGWE
jgi:Rps23 Pro-64 3,4-dihydroxylase Tpa1-like proline 4-hydroxylase